MMLLLYIFNLS